MVKTYFVWKSTSLGKKTLVAWCTCRLHLLTGKRGGNGLEMSDFN